MEDEPRKKNVELLEDDELSKLVPKAVDSDLAGLERSIRSEGCRDPLVAWRPPGEEGSPPILLDGHTRYRICRTHRIDYEVTLLPLGSREEAKAWVIDAQLSRRNLTTAGRCEVALGLEPLLKEAAAERQRRGGGVGGRAKPSAGGRSKLPPDPAGASGGSSEAESLVDALLRARKVPRRGEARVQAAKLAGVGKSSVDSYEEVKNAAEIEGHPYARELLDKLLRDPSKDLSVDGAKRELRSRREWEASEAGWEEEDDEDERTLNGSSVASPDADDAMGEPRDGDAAPADPSGDPMDGIPTRRPRKWRREVPVWGNGEFQDFVGGLRKKSVKLLLTDPPYGAGVGKTFSGDENPEKAAGLLSEMLRAFEQKLKDEAHVVIFVGVRQEARMRRVLEKVAPYLVERDPLVWVKSKPSNPLEAEGSVYGDPRSFGPAYERALHLTKGEPRLRRRKPNAYIAQRTPKSVHGHETVKPVGMLRQIVEATTGGGAVVADPFGGTASTLEAALRSGRRAWGTEKEPTHHLAGTRRLNAVMEELRGAAAQLPFPGLEMVLQDSAGRDLEPSALGALPDPLPGVPTTVWGFGEPPEEFRLVAEPEHLGLEGYYIWPARSGWAAWRVFAEAIPDDGMDHEFLGVFARRPEAAEAVREHARVRGDEFRDVWCADPGDDSYFEVPEFWDE